MADWWCDKCGLVQDDPKTEPTSQAERTALLRAFQRQMAHGEWYALSTEINRLLNIQTAAERVTTALQNLLDGRSGSVDAAIAALAEWRAVQR